MRRNSYKIYKEIVFGLLGNKCKECDGKNRLGIHHLDGDITNNKKKNILLLCNLCHMNKYHVPLIKEIVRKINKDRGRRMKSKTCKKCGKVIEGYSNKQVDYMMAQHNLTHKLKDKKEKTK
jgi:hypothetical protein